MIVPEFYQAEAILARFVLKENTAKYHLMALIMDKAWLRRPSMWKLGGGGHMKLPADRNQRRLVEAGTDCHLPRSPRWTGERTHRIPQQPCIEQEHQAVEL